MRAIVPKAEGIAVAAPEHGFPLRLGGVVAVWGSEEKGARGVGDSEVAGLSPCQLPPYPHSQSYHSDFFLFTYLFIFKFI